MSLQILKSGILSTLQDEGRIGFEAAGINPGGVMDWFAFRLLNILLKNPPNEAALEIHFPAPIFQFNTTTTCCITGADFTATVNNQNIIVNKTFIVHSGDILQFNTQKSGVRAYLGVAGGYKTEKWLASVSPSIAADFGIQNLVKNQLLNFKNPTINPTLFGANIIVKPSSAPLNIRYLPEASIIKGIFSINHDANRMGFRLNGPSMAQNIQGILSSAITFGTIQQLSTGQLIVLMADHQTSGGYNRLGTVIKADLPLLAQLQPNVSFMFEAVSINFAEELYMQQLAALQKLAASISLQKD